MTHSVGMKLSRHQGNERKTKRECQNEHILTSCAVATFFPCTALCGAFIAVVPKMPRVQGCRIFLLTRHGMGTLERRRTSDTSDSSELIFVGWPSVVNRVTAEAISQQLAFHRCLKLGRRPTVWTAKYRRHARRQAEMTMGENEHDFSSEINRETVERVGYEKGKTLTFNWMRYFSVTAYDGIAVRQRCKLCRRLLLCGEG